jgi:hypothetical protein
MKKPSQNPLVLVALFAGLCSPPLAAVAHPPIARPVTQASICSPNLQIENVKYLGRNNGQDSVQVVFNGLPANVFNGSPNNGPGNFNNAASASCGKYGVPPVSQQGAFQGAVSSNQIVQQGIGGGGNPAFGYELTVTVTRRLGHQDTGTARSTNIFSGQITTVVQIPRAALESEPVKYDVTINTTFGGSARRTLTVQGNSAPALAGATQTFANTSLVPLPDNCFPSVSITGLSFTAGSGSTPDAVTVNWTANHPPSDCFFGPRVFVSVEVKRPDNSTGRASTQPSANTVTLNLSGAPAAPVSFVVRVSAETSLGLQFQVNKKGDF